MTFCKIFITDDSSYITIQDKNDLKIYCPEVNISNKNHISIERFREMDRVSVEKYQISIELMMENAGLQLARLVTKTIPSTCNILIGIGTGNSIFKPDMILTLAAMKTELIPLTRHIDIYLADLGLPRDVYTQSGIEQPEEFKVCGLLKCNFV